MYLSNSLHLPNILRKIGTAIGQCLLIDLASFGGFVERLVGGV